MQSGRLNQRITLLQPSGTTRNDAGEIIPTITEVGPMWASVEFKGAGSDEKQLADQKTAITAVNFTVRNNPDVTITTRDEIVYRSVKYAIRSVLEADPKRCFWKIEAEQLGENYTYTAPVAPR